jgi:hypothetical protein
MNRKHEDSAMCWCRPKVEQQCRTCRGHGVEEGSDLALPCWRCHGVGWLPGHPDDTGLLIIHRDIDEADVEQPAVACRGILLVLIAAAILLVAAAMVVFR